MAQRKVGSAEAKVASVKSLQNAYNERKAKLMLREEENFDRVMLFWSDKNWWKIAGHSVVFYSKLIIPRMGKDASVKIWNDEDFVSKSKYGIIKISNIDRTLGMASSLGYRVFKRSEGYAEIFLNNKVTAEELNKMANEDEQLWKMLARSVESEVIWPDLKVEISILNTIVHHAVAKMDAKVSRVYGEPMDKLALDMVLTFNDAMYGDIEPIEALDRMMADRRRMNGYMMSAISLRIFTLKKTEAIEKQLGLVESAIVREVKRIEKERIKEQSNGQKKVSDKDGNKK